MCYMCLTKCLNLVTDMLLTLVWFRDRPDRWRRGVLRPPEVGVPGGVHALGVPRPRFEHLLHVAAGGPGERGRLGVPRRRRGRRRGEGPEEEAHFQLLKKGATIRSLTTHLYDVPFWTMGATMPEVSEPLDGEAWHCCSRPMALRVDRCMAPRVVLVTSSMWDYLRYSELG